MISVSLTCPLLVTALIVWFSFSFNKVMKICLYFLKSLSSSWWVWISSSWPACVRVLGSVSGRTREVYPWSITVASVPLTGNYSLTPEWSILYSLFSVFLICPCTNHMVLLLYLLVKSLYLLLIVVKIAMVILNLFHVLVNVGMSLWIQEKSQLWFWYVLMASVG